MISKILSIILLLIVMSNSVLANDLVVLSADWCKNCITLKEFIDNNPKKFKTFKNIQILDIEKNQDLAKIFKIKSVPTSIIFKDDGSVKSIMVGYDKSYDKWIKNNEK